MGEGEGCEREREREERGRERGEEVRGSERRCCILLLSSPHYHTASVTDLTLCHSVRSEHCPLLVLHTYCLEWYVSLETLWERLQQGLEGPGREGGRGGREGGREREREGERG